MKPARGARPDFFALIDRMAGAPDAERPGLEAGIWSAFGVEQAVLSLDMSQFSLSVRRGGILPYLALIRRMHRLTRPIVERHRGQVVKFVADNLIAAFASTGDALEAAVAIQLAVPTDGPGTFAASIGIDHGRFLLVPGEECYGDTVNVACKLGEDLARPGEILLTAAARERLGTCPYSLSEQLASVTGLELRTYSVEIPRA